MTLSTVLPAARRLRHAQDFQRAIRSGRRSGSRLLVVHVADGRPDQPSGCGFVVSRAVGSAVRRNQVKRRLRHLVRQRLDLLPDGQVYVIRANPAAASASYTELGRDLDRCLGRVEDGRRRDGDEVTTP